MMMRFGERFARTSTRGVTLSTQIFPRALWNEALACVKIVASTSTALMVRSS
jgi:hypothetical protein